MGARALTLEDLVDCSRVFIFTIDSVSQDKLFTLSNTVCTVKDRSVAISLGSWNNPGRQIS